MLLRALIFVAAATSTAQAQVQLSKSKVPATGRGEVILTVAQHGRYAIAAESKGGTAVQLVSKMQGPLAIYGRAGERNGRFDMILDKGTYKIVTWSSSKGKGEATITARPFKEKHAELPDLVELKPIHETLDDYEQRSYWLPISQTRTVLIEMAGRNLAEVRVWKDGEWLLDTAAETEQVQPVVGRPLTVIRKTLRLEPGLYSIVAYGGPALPWAEENKTHPFHARMGIPELPDSGRFSAEVGPFGVERYRVPARTTYFRVEVPEAKPLALNVQGTSESAFGGHGSSAVIDKKSIPPVAQLFTSSTSPQIVTISGAQGQPYTLQYFVRSRETYLSRVTDYWIETQHAGVAVDSLDPTALVACGGIVRQHSAIPLDATHGYKRRFNLLAPVTLFVEVKDAGDYQVDIGGDGVQAMYRFEPFLITRPRNYETPPLQKSQTSFALDRGFYVLSLSPSQKGIAELAIKKTSGLRGMLNRITDLPASPVRTGSLFQRVTVPSALESCTVYMNEQNVPSGAIVRELPLRLEQALALGSHDRATIPFVADEPGRLVFTGARAKAITLDGAALGQAVSKGSHELVVEGGAGTTITFIPASKEAPLPRSNAKPQVLPELAFGEPRFFDLERSSELFMRVRVKEAGLYRLESTGLLAMRGAIRTRTVTSLDTQEQNGVGRNFSIQQYLREGDYLLSVATAGQSAGHFGVQLVRAPIQDGGLLLDGIVARAGVPAGTAVLYRFDVPKAASYRLRSFGIGRTFKARLEDRDGWPVEPPNLAADLSLRLQPGGYRFFLLPEIVDTLQLTRMDRAKKSVMRDGHGPHDLELGDCGSLTWRESKERTPDQWRFTLPAEANVAISLSARMGGALLDATSRRQVAELQAAKAYSATLPKGSYLIETTNTRTDDRVPYQACVRTTELVDGVTRSANAPATLAVSVGRAGLVELASFGAEDVRASLFDAQGNLVTTSDDRENDWSFHVATTLAAGRYSLRVEPVGRDTAAFTVEMRMPAEIQEPALTLPATIEKKAVEGVSVFPLPPLGEGQDAVVALATANEGIGIAIEQNDNGKWVLAGTDQGTRARLLVPAKLGAQLRARLWSIDHRATPVKLQIAAVKARVEDEGDLASGEEARAIDGLALGVAAFEVKRPGVFAFAGSADGLRWTSSTGLAAQPAPDAVMALQTSRVWILSDTPGRKVKAKRIVLSGDETSVSVPPRGVATADLEAKGGPVVVIASSRTGQPGVKVQERDGKSAAPEAGMAPSVRGALAVSLVPSEPQAVVWPAASVREAMDVKLRAVRFAKPAKAQLVLGAQQVLVSGAVAYELPKGPKRVHIVADAAIVAVLSQDDGPLATLWGGNARLDETIETTANRLTLLNTDAKALPADVTVLNGQEPVTLQTTAPSFRRFASGGRERVPLAAEGFERTLWIRGAKDVVVLAADGSIRRGSEIAVPPSGGVAIVPHEPGLVALWLERGGGFGPGLWGSARGVGSKDLVGGERVALDDSQARFVLKASTPTVFHLRSEAAALVNVKRKDAQDVSLHASSIAADVYVADGPVEVTLRSLGTKTLGGSLEVTTTPVTALKEGLGPEVLLGGGQSRFYSFNVSRSATVGIGVRSDADRIDAALLDLSGKLLGRGVAQMLSLAAGTYLLSVRLPDAAPPAKLRPAVVGLDPPDIGPPPEVARSYYRADSVEFSSRQSDRDPDEPQPEEAAPSEDTPSDEQPEEQPYTEEEPATDE